MGEVASYFPPAGEKASTDPREIYERAQVAGNIVCDSGASGWRDRSGDRGDQPANEGQVNQSNMTASGSQHRTRCRLDRFLPADFEQSRSASLISSLADAYLPPATAHSRSLGRRKWVSRAPPNSSSVPFTVEFEAGQSPPWGIFRRDAPTRSLPTDCPQDAARVPHSLGYGRSLAMWPFFSALAVA